MEQRDAFDLGLRLRNQGATWATIAETLAQKGYKSPLTRRQLTPIGVRHFITHFESVEKKADQLEEKRIEVMVDPGAGEQLEVIKALLEVKVPEKRKMDLIKAVLAVIS